MADYPPGWICAECGKKYGTRQAGFSTWHPNICAWCNQDKGVTHPRHYGYPPAPTDKGTSNG